MQTLTFQSRSYLHSAMDAHSSSFSSFSAYLRALSLTPSRLSRRAFSVSTSFDEMTSTRSTSGVHMHRTLRWFDLVGFGLGGMVGAGVFVTTGPAAHQAGPAIVLSYAIAGLCALLSAFCYTEFAVDMPVAGGAFSYLRITFGAASWFYFYFKCVCLIWSFPCFFSLGDFCLFVFVYRWIRWIFDRCESDNGLCDVQRRCRQEFHSIPRRRNRYFHL